MMIITVSPVIISQHSKSPREFIGPVGDGQP